MAAARKVYVSEEPSSGEPGRSKSDHESVCAVYSPPTVNCNSSIILPDGEAKVWCPIMSEQNLCWSDTPVRST